MTDLVQPASMGVIAQTVLLWVALKLLKLTVDTAIKHFLKGEKVEEKVAIGSEANLDVQLTGGNLILTLSWAGASGSASMTTTQNVKYFLEKLKTALPNNIVIDGVIDAAEAAVSST